MKRVIIAVALAIFGSLIALPGAQAAQSEKLGALKATVVNKPTCDRRAPRVDVTLTRVATGIRFGYVDTSADFVLKSGMTQPGTYRFTLPRQPFGSARTWVMVVLYKGDQDATTSEPLRFKRPKAENCVRTQLHELRSFGAGINKACPRGTVKDYLIRVWIKRGSPGYITWPGTATLTQKNGRFKSATGQLLGKNARIAEYHVIWGRLSRLDFDAAQDVDVSVSSLNVKLRSSVVPVCTGAGT